MNGKKARSRGITSFFPVLGRIRSCPTDQEDTALSSSGRTLLSHPSINRVSFSKHKQVSITPHGRESIRGFTSLVGRWERDVLPLTQAF